MNIPIFKDFQHLGLFFGTLALTLIIGWLFNRLLYRIIKNSTQIMQNDPTNYKFFRRVITVLIYTVGFSIAIYMIPGMRTLAQSLLAGAGILALAAGFASQHALSNILSGMFIVLFKPFRIGDRLQIRDLSGKVEDITLRHTVIRDYQNKRIIVPNTVISDEILINADFTADGSCSWIDISIGYEADLDLAKKLLSEEVNQHPLLIDKRSQAQKTAGAPKANVRVVSLANYAISLRAWAWAKDATDAFEIQCDVYENIIRKYAAEGIPMPSMPRPATGA